MSAVAPAKTRRRFGGSLYVFLLVALVPAVAATVIADKFYLHVLIMMLFYAGASLAWNIVGGYAGQLSLGHAAFFGIGAYTSSLLFVNDGISPWIGMLVGAVIATVVGAVIGYPSFRLRGASTFGVTGSSLLLRCGLDRRASACGQCPCRVGAAQAGNSS